MLGGLFAVFLAFTRHLREFLVGQKHFIHGCAFFCEVGTDLKLCLDSVHFQTVSLVGKEDKYTSSLGLRRMEDKVLKRRTVLPKGGRLATLVLPLTHYPIPN